MSKRTSIVNSLVTLIKGINGSSPYTSNLFTNVENKLLFWDEIHDWPYVSIIAGEESREYLPAGFKWGFLTINVKIYVNSDNSLQDLEDIIEDIEYVLDNNSTFTYQTGKTIEDILILNISTDEGLLHPYGVGELIIQVRYDV